ncbi:hypothetical protein E1B28_006919 [Marasmius oreades]|uniref:Gag-like protein n=1 Tax=Marasmius oreades TaxID=181124 RepID=A0A9P7S158_9AGAR|nr:uncharacterized protein E1B28_006919 [Marasmius oreades]KAG7093233.1 hypothetical protein E1B28_006919 [Marasmius oreades]
MEEEFQHSKPADASDIDMAINMIQEHAENIQNNAVVTMHQIMASEMKTMMTQFTAQQRDTNNKLEEILKQNSNLNGRIRDLENKLDKVNQQNDTMRQMMADLIATGIPHGVDAYSSAVRNQDKRGDTTMNKIRANAKPSMPNHNQSSKTKNTTPNKATAVHHPSRLVVRFQPDGIQEHDKVSPEELTRNINNAMWNANVVRTMQGIPTKDPPLVVAARYTERNSSLVISTCEDQTADHLLEFFNNFKGALAIDIGKYKLEAHADKKWFKIQVDNVATLDYYRNVLEPDAILKELATNNPSVQELTKIGHLSMPPRWLIPAKELKCQSRRGSSFIFATDIEEKAIKIVKGGHLVLFGHYCGVCPFQDRPLVQQCNDCWRFGHFTKTCKNPKACRICSSEEHNESRHQSTCSNCQAVAMAEGYEDDMMGTCDHHLRCGNCYQAGNTENLTHAANSRDCPIQKQLYGTARNNEKSAIKKGTPYQITNKKTCKPKKKNDVVATVTISNRFSLLNPDSDMAANTTTTQQLVMCGLGPVNSQARALSPSSGH